MRVRLHHIHIFASDMEATIRFWQDMFGAQIQFDREAAGARVVVLAIGSGMEQEIKHDTYHQPVNTPVG